MRSSDGLDQAAFELLTLYQNINAERALALGMINRIVPKDALVNEARRVAEQRAGFDHDALWMTKRTIQRAAATPRSRPSTWPEGRRHW